MRLDREILSSIVVYMKYAKYKPELKRREGWDELVTRNLNMHLRKFPEMEEEIRWAYQFVYDKKVLPSMRSMQFAGKPIALNPARIYNCAYLPIDSIESFAETMFLLLGGTGVGYSVQKHHINKLPHISRPHEEQRFLVGDSIEGWSDSVKVLMKAYLDPTYDVKPNFDYRDIREKGERLVTSGGKAPGPEPLKECHDAIERILESKDNYDQLTSIEVHDIICHIADCVLAGGIRRAALISLFTFDDEDMRNAKNSHMEIDVLRKEDHPEDDDKYIIDVVHNDKRINGVEISKFNYQQYEDDGTVHWAALYPERARANNSAVALRSKIKKDDFLELWQDIEDSKAGEPGIYFSNDKDWGSNPCCEIALRPYQFCNLCEINSSNIESQEDLEERAKAAAIIGTLQATYTDFHYLRPVWKRTTKRDALIGIGMTGIASKNVLDKDLESAAEIAKDVNKEFSDKLGINEASRVTTVKPSGTSSLVLGCSSGIHAWHNDFYIRRMRVGKAEAIYPYLEENHPELVEDDITRPDTQAVISVPQKAPENAILRHESALDMLERVKKFNLEWVRAGHRKGMNANNVSATVSIKDEEWDEVGEWMWTHRHTYNGLSILPFDGGTYQQSPFEDITKEEFYELMEPLSSVDLKNIEEEHDNTDLQGEIACGGGECEVTIL